MNNFGEKVSFIWSVADLIRGPYRPNQYKDVMLPIKGFSSRAREIIENFGFEELIRRFNEASNEEAGDHAALT